MKAHDVTMETEVPISGFRNLELWPFKSEIKIYFTLIRTGQNCGRMRVAYKFYVFLLTFDSTFFLGEYKL